MEEDKSTREKLTLELMEEMKRVTFPQCHAGDNIVHNVHRKLIDGEVKKEDAEKELLRLVENSRKSIEKYALSTLKIIQDNNLTRESWGSIQGSALPTILHGGLFKDQTKLE